ncbi:glycosyltransferase family 2 protein [Paracoccus chinensis]|uniref:Glycosyl transferase family 2 n=1 Tax=Paracoccus chinensis TaxID=525640 RepID=A0A1G9K9E2_9RHOB|nr:glycosyltransferase family 2 protein [Paracoccus chinensis]SDL46520.1 Glycosyl transferase family 2 [Paracoccus chinensis]
MPQPQVTVLMALYQGERYLRAQLDSIAAQTADWKLVVGDDGSNDAGPQIVQEFAREWPGRVELRAGPCQGAAANFMTLLAGLPEAPRHVALADQDDVWHADKLSRALAALESGGDQPALYCSRVQICDEALGPLGLSHLPVRPPSFRHALVQNLVQGNTAVLNPAAPALARAGAQGAGKVVMHDWWLYQLVSGAGGRVIHDPWPSLLYRQHGANVVGANDSAGARLASLNRMLNGRHRDWSRANLREMQRLRNRLTPENRPLLDDFAALAGPGALARLRALRRGGFYRQGQLSQAALWLAAALGRV